MFNLRDSHSIQRTHQQTNTQTLLSYIFMIAIVTRNGKTEYNNLNLRATTKALQRKREKKN